MSELSEAKEITEEFMKKIKKIIESSVNIIIVKFGEDRSGMSEINQLIALNKGSE